MVWLRTEKPTDIWRHLQISGGIFRYYPHINEILTCHMEYTESLPPPPGTHEAWPTKPRSVSYWPGLAGLKAGRLSAGRPGHLRTLSLPRAQQPIPFIVLTTASDMRLGSIHHRKESDSGRIGGCGAHEFCDVWLSCISTRVCGRDMGGRECICLCRDR